MNLRKELKLLIAKLEEEHHPNALNEARRLMKIKYPNWRTKESFAKIAKSKPHKLYYYT